MAKLLLFRPPEKSSPASGDSALWPSDSSLKGTPTDVLGSHLGSAHIVGVSFNVTMEVQAMEGMSLMGWSESGRLHKVVL
jgi:hypothetical protein